MRRGRRVLAASEAERAALARIARRLGRLAARGNPATATRRLPSLWLFTDPARLSDPLAAAAALPRGSGVVLRTFGRPEVERLAPALAALAQRRGLVLLVGEDVALAARVGAAGVHLPQRRLGDLTRLRSRRPGWIITAAVHDALAIRQAARLGADAAFLSAVFASGSPSAGRALGVVRLARLTRAANLPLYALGGATSVTAKRLVGTGVAGVAAVEALRT